MSSFRIEPARPGVAARLYHQCNARLAVAVVFPLDGNAVELFPVECDRPPAPLTGRSQTFADMDALRAFVGLAPEAIAA